MGTEAVRFLVLWMAGWVNSRQLEVIDFLREENRVLREQLGRRRLRFTDDQRRRLAAKGRIVGRRRLGEFAGFDAVLDELDQPSVADGVEGTHDILPITTSTAFPSA